MLLPHNSQEYLKPISNESVALSSLTSIFLSVAANGFSNCIKRCLVSFRVPVGLSKPSGSLEKSHKSQMSIHTSTK